MLYTPNADAFDIEGQYALSLSYLRSFKSSTLIKSTIKEIDRIEGLISQDKKTLRKKWKDNIENRKKKTHVVFFGNGLFPTGGSGYPCVPRKRFLRYLAASGVVVILDEFKTSKCCPGCHNELEDTDEKRVRRCKSDQSVSCLLSSENGAPFKDDRDVIATINMAICAHGLLVSGKRPKYLSREKYKRGTVEF